MESNKTPIELRWSIPREVWFNLLLLPLLAAWLYTLSVLIHNYWSTYSSYSTTSKTFQEGIRDQERAFVRWSNDSARLNKWLSNPADAAQLEVLQKLNFQVFAYAQEGGGNLNLLAWSTNEVQPEMRLARPESSGSLVLLGNGYYEQMVERRFIGGQNVVLVGLIHLYRQYRIENANLAPTFPNQPRLDRYFKFQETPTRYEITNHRSQVIAWLKPLQSRPPYTSNMAEFFLQLAALLVLLYFFSQLWLRLMRIGRQALGVVGLVATWAAMFFLLPSIEVLLDWRSLIPQSKPILETSTYSLVDLVYKSSVSLWALVVLSFEWKHLVRHIPRLPWVARWLFAVLFCLLGLYVQFQLIKWIHELYLDLGVAFDVTNFFSLDYTTILGFLFLFMGVSIHLLYHAMVLPVIMEVANQKLAWVAILICACGLSFLSFSKDFAVNTSLMFSLIWLVGLVAAFRKYPFPIAPVRTSISAIWLFVYALFIGVIMSSLSTQRLQNRTKELSKGLMLQQDKSSEYLIRVASVKLRRVGWSEVYSRLRESPDPRSVRDSVTSQYFGGYLDRFNTGFFCFSPNGEPLGNDQKNLETLNLLFNAAQKDPVYPWLAKYAEAYDRFGYMIKLNPVSKDSIPLGTVFFITRSVLPFSGDFAPEFLRQLVDVNTSWPRGFSYAWYHKGVLVNQYRNYPFVARLPADFMQSKDEKGIDGKDAYEWWQVAPPNNVLVVAAGKRLLVGYMSLVSYLFSTFLFIFIFFRVLAWFVPTRKSQVRFFQPFTSGIQNRLRITIVGILVFSFLVIALVTTNFFLNQFAETNEVKLATNINNAANYLQGRMPDGFANVRPAQQAAFYQNGLKAIISGNDFDVNLYSPEGMLLASTQEVIYGRDILAPLMDPAALANMKAGKNFRYFSQETLGSLSYRSIYQPLLDKQNNLLGYLQVPYFASNNLLREEIAGFVVVLINVIAFVFLLSGFIALLASGNITKSLNLISEKMNRIVLTGENERIEWHRDDEIGKLVSQYNHTLQALEESARLLAKNEREMAWRDMARQVAHEIKNPLTPMKLSLQFLQNAIAAGKPDIEAITMRTTRNLVDQIDHLSRIAYEFSQFAHIGQPDNVRFDLHEVLDSIVPLYKTHEHILVQWQRLPRSLPVYADKTQINRLFTNLLQNAVEALAEVPNGKIIIEEWVEGSQVGIRISDNGPGIPDEARAKIFTPNFTTKSSGTGLGLAICKAIVERAEGDISFSSSAGSGTSFTVMLNLQES